MQKSENRADLLETNRMDWDDARPKKKPAHELGADLTVLSVNDLEEYLAVLSTERQRVETMLAAKKASQRAAHSAFKA
jgi:uncharacterized small protein (DUF1192 family)